MSSIAPLIVVVDDDDDIREAFREALAREGFETAVASDGWQGLELLRRHAGRSCVVVIDLMMPVMDGLELLWRIEAEGLRAVPLVVTAMREPQIPAGVAYLAKPVTRDQLVAAVRDAADQLVSVH